MCVNPDNGAVDFSFPWRGRRDESVNASAPLIVDDKVFISECYGKGGVLLQLSLDQAGKFSAKTLWETDKLGTHFMTALPLNGHLYGCDGHGPTNCPLVCLDLASGEEQWRTEPDLAEEITTRTSEKKTLRLNTDRCHLLHADGPRPLAGGVQGDGADVAFRRRGDLVTARPFARPPLHQPEHTRPPQQNTAAPDLL